jgi:hypothetical protein
MRVLGETHMTTDLGEFSLIMAYGLIADKIILTMARMPNQILSEKDLYRFNRLSKMLEAATQAIQKIDNLQIDGDFVEQSWVYESIRNALAQNSLYALKGQADAQIKFIQTIVGRIIEDRQFGPEESSLKEFLTLISSYTTARHDEIYSRIA